MESRVKEIGGRFEIANRHGTLINLEIPLKA
jgi:signal transduction histidine kinase